MHMKAKKILALGTAILTVWCMPVNIFADTLVQRDGLKYLVSDSGEEKGLYSGWSKKGDDYYYYKDGVMKKNCWIMSEGKKKYFLRSDGSRAVGNVTIRGVSYKFDSKGVIMPDEWGVELSVKDVSPTGLTVVFTQSGGHPSGELITGTYFTVERYENGSWQTVDEIPSEYDRVWDDIAWIIAMDETREFEESWKGLYGELPAGQYRIGKEVTDFRRTADYDNKMYWAYFEI